MKFHFDTEKNENLLLTFNPDENPQKSIYDLCYGLSVMYTEFCVQLGLDEEDARNLLSVCQSIMTKNVEEYISNGILEQDDESDEVDGVSDEDLDTLKKSMTAAGFSEEEVQNITALVKDVGIDGALDVLRGIGREVCDNWTEFEKGVEDFISSRTPDTDDEDDAEGVSDEEFDEAKAMCDKMVHTFVHERYEYDDENEFVDDMTEQLPEVYLDYDLIHKTISVKLDIGSGYTLTSMDVDLYEKDRSAAEKKVHTAELAIRILYDEMITINENPLRASSWIPLEKQLPSFLESI